MGDSEDEFDRRREKFRRERSDIYERRGERDWSRERPRGWSNGGGAPDMKRGGLRPPPSVPSESMHRRREYPTQPPHEMKRRFSPGREAEMRNRKRMRGYDPAFEGGWGPAPGWEHPGSVRPAFHPPEEWGQGDRGIKMRMEMEKMGQRMLTFKQWLHSQPDDISDEDAIKNYTEYKISYKRQQLQDFFIAHKDEEWFKEKYHPDDSTKREKEHRNALKRRADVFKTLVDSGLVDQVSLDLNNETQIIKVLDSAVIYMEGGNEDDLKILDEVKVAPEAAADTETIGETKAGQEEGEVTDDKVEEGELNEGKKDEFKVEYLTEEQHELKKQAELYKQLVADKPEGGAQDEKSKVTKKKKKKRDREYRGYDDDGEGSSSSSGSSSSDSSSSSNSDEDEANEKKPTTPEEAKATEETVKKEEDVKVEEKELAKEPEVVEAPKPRALHRTYSIFMRNLPPSVTRNDIINLCKKFPGFIRVAFSQPLEDHNRFIRRCWVTFDRSVNIKDICWNLNNTRLRDMELNPVVNRDLARRVRPISGIAQHKSCARNDLKNIVRLIMHLDEKSKIWVQEEKEPEKAEPTKESEQDTAIQQDTPEAESALAKKVSAQDSTRTGKNPWLENISEFLVDESSAEEDELLGAPPAAEQCEEGEEAGSFVTVQRHGPLLQQVDRLLYYLRLVHSVDYYNASEYPNEDEMPNRCGIIHARGPIPPNKLTKEDINEFQKRFNDKLMPILTFQDKIKQEDVAKLGIKEVNSEVEKFVTANSQELGKDKWLCPLSGKKFKGPDYIRKHIFNKHVDKVDAVKNDVLYFNNYLMDPGRPGPPDGQRPGLPGPPGHPGSGPPNPSPSSSGYGSGGGLYGGPPPMFGDPGRSQFLTPQFHHRPPSAMYNNGGRTYPPKQRDMRPRDAYAGRPIVEYRDLDAPDDADFF